MVSSVFVILLISSFMILYNCDFLRSSFLWQVVFFPIALLICQTYVSVLLIIVSQIHIWVLTFIFFCHSMEISAPIIFLMLLILGSSHQCYLLWCIRIRICYKLWLFPFSIFISSVLPPIHRYSFLFKFIVKSHLQYSSFKYLNILNVFRILWIFPFHHISVSTDIMVHHGEYWRKLVTFYILNVVFSWYYNLLLINFQFLLMHTLVHKFFNCFD